jgi:carbamoyltransferase
MAPTRILGISAYYHDSAAALVCDGEIVAAAQEERFSRRKHDAAFPSRAAGSCLQRAGLTIADIDVVAFYEKPLLKFERLIDTYLTFAPRGLPSFVASMPVWTREKLFQRALVRRALAALPGADTGRAPRLVFPAHHHSHAASAFFPSPFARAAVLCVDGVGERATTSAWLGEGNRLTPLWTLDFPHSLGLLYSAFTQYLGFRVNSAEYKVMGLAPYGEPRFVDRILGNLLDLKEDGTFRLDMRYFGFATGLAMTNRRFHELFGGPPREPEGALGQREKDLARSIQAVTEDVVLRLARTLRRETGETRLCLAGGVALNCVANARIAREAGFDDVWIQPAAGDAGGALGAALAAWHEHVGAPRVPSPGDGMKGALLGPRFDDAAIEETLRRFGAVAHVLPEEEDLLSQTADLLAQGGVVGWFQGAMEYGPRALGNRSILGDPRDPGMQSRMNLKIKFRESFRPFAPAISRERAREHFELDRESPYMLLVAQVAEGSRHALPAVTHVDGSARVQTVSAEMNPRFYRLLSAFERRTGCPVLVNTSFNVRSEPIVATPEDAYRCFMKTGMDHLVLGGRLLHKAEQPPLREPSPPERASAGPRRGATLAVAARLASGVRALWMRLAEALGWFNTRIIFGAVHLLVVVPYALAIRAVGKPPLELGFDRTATSYRKEAAAERPGAFDRPY